MDIIPRIMSTLVRRTYYFEVLWDLLKKIRVLPSWRLLERREKMPVKLVISDILRV